jgi:rare lipoprotein A (peptidoglycan hydrolase)
LPWNRFARHRAAVSLVLAGSIALIGVQQVLGAVADAQTTEAIVDAHDLQPLGASLSATQPQTVTAAVPSGQFEDVHQPTPTPAPTQVPTAVPTTVPMPAPTAAQAATLFESGIASTYGEGDGFEGNRTACGQIFHTSVVQIAHKSLPCGTLVRVVDTDTGTSVEARVTDRGPYVSGRIVDLSWGAFKQLDPTGPGLLHVNVYLLDD